MSGCPGWQSVNPLCRAKQLVGGAGKAVGEDVFNSIAHHFAGVANAAVSWLWQQLSDATSIDLTSPALKGDLIATGAIAAFVTFTLFLIQVIAAALRQDVGGLGRGVRGLGVAFIGAAFAIGATQVLLAAVDALCNGVVRFALGTDTRGMGSKLIAAAALSQITNPAGLLLISLVLIGAVVVVWVALMIRKMLIIVSAVFAPVAFSGASSDISRSWVRRWIEFTVALVFSKLILVIIFMVGLSVLQGAGENSSGNGTTNSITNLVIGALTLLLAGFAPWMAIKMVHFAGDTFHAVHGQAAGAAAGGRTVVRAPQKIAAVTSGRPYGAMRPMGTARAQTAGQPKSRGPSGAGGGGTSSAVPGGGGGAVPAAGAAPIAGVAVATAGPRLASAAGRRTGDAVDRVADPHRRDLAGGRQRSADQCAEGR